jgi:copper homeostasis protein
MRHCVLEIACFNVESAVIAYKNGADRIEICDDVLCGGKTPSDSVINEIIERTGSIDRMVMIHREGNQYCYTNQDSDWMLNRIHQLNEKKIHGYVFGATTQDGKPDYTLLTRLIRAANGRPCTFHRAFDNLENKSEVMERLIDLGFARILTSGGKGNAIDNLAVLSELQAAASGRIIILAGGGLRSGHAENLIRQTNVNEIHSSAIIENGTANAEEVTALKAICNYLS